MVYQNKYNKPFTPRKPVKTFRDLDVYQKSMECAVIITKNLRPKLVLQNYLFLEGMTNCAMSVPLFLAEAHSIRFGNFTLGLSLLEKAMSDCNKMIVYLEHIKGLYGNKIDAELADSLISRYADCRSKSFHLEMSWKKFNTPTRFDNQAKNFKL